MSVEKDDTNFGGWEEPSDIDFFGTESEASAEEVLDLIDQAAEEDKTEEEKNTETPKEKEPEVDFFGNEEETPTDTPAETTKTKEAPVEKIVSSTKSSLELLKEKGLVEYELEEGEDLTEEKAGELLETSFEDRVEGRVGEILSEIPESVRDIVAFAKDGGDVKTLLSTLATQATASFTKDTDMTVEANQEAVVRADLKENGYDDDLITANIEALKDSGKLETSSQALLTKRLDKEKVFLQTQATQQAKDRATSIEKQKAYKKGLSTLLAESKQIDKIKISRKDKTELPAYISDRSVKLENGSTVSPLQRDMMAALQDEKKTVMLAKILKSDFDFSDLAKTAETQVTKKVKKGLQNSDSLTSKGAAQSSQKGFAEYF